MKFCEIKISIKKKRLRTQFREVMKNVLKNQRNLLCTLYRWATISSSKYLVDTSRYLSKTLKSVKY